MNTFNQGGSPENPSRRGFLKGMLAVAAVAATGIAGNKYVIEEEKKSNDLSLSLKGQEHNPTKAKEVIDMLLIEMDKTNPPLERVHISGTGSNISNTIDILRNFLTDHLNSSLGNKYPLKPNVFTSGFYTRENLLLLRITAARLSESKK